jgi:ribosomal protein L7Ae-like RNA K-turn-binding protein
MEKEKRLTASAKKAQRSGHMRVQSPPASLVRCVLSPSGEIIADVGASLPASSPHLWLGAFPDVIDRAWDVGLQHIIGGTITSKAAFLSQWQHTLDVHILQTLAMAHKAHMCVLGYDALLKEIPKGKCALLVIAGDAGKSDRQKLVHLAEKHAIPVMMFADRHILAKPYGRSAQVYVGIQSGAMAKKLHHFLLCNTRFNERDSL